MLDATELEKQFKIAKNHGLHGAYEKLSYLGSFSPNIYGTPFKMGHRHTKMGIIFIKSPPPTNRDYIVIAVRGYDFLYSPVYLCVCLCVCVCVTRTG